MRRLLPTVLLMLAVVGCGPTQAIRSEFAEEFTARNERKPFEVVDVVKYRAASGRTLYRAYGYFRDEPNRRVGVVWADYGRLPSDRWEPVEFPATPWTYVLSPAEAREAIKGDKIRLKSAEAAAASAEAARKGAKEETPG